MGFGGAQMTRPAWDFHYAPVAANAVDDGRPATDLIVATETDVDPALISGAVASFGTDVAIEPLLSLHPLFWTRVRAGKPIDRTVLAQRVEALGVPVRYVTSSRRASMKPAPMLDTGSARPRSPSRWQSRAETSYEDPRVRGRWFLEENGVAVDREVCGTGAGTRLAIIDNDAGSSEHLELDAEILVHATEVPRGSRHGAALAGWAVGAYVDEARKRFRAGVAPSASLRLYLIPKPGGDVFTVPLAIVRAVDDGADVVVCATYVEGLSSPLLDDALEFAYHLGRSGRGSAVVFPTGREVSSAAGSVHASLSIALGDPAADPRVFCVGPSSSDGGWFLWRDRRARLRPFANRGPSVRWLAPGDDLASPFSDLDRPIHAESSGASAVAAGVLLLVLGVSPHLTVSELHAIVTRTATRVAPPGPSENADIADPQDVLPYGRDKDDHDAKHGYGRLHATRACLAASDPFAHAMISMGEDNAARKWLTLRQNERRLTYAYSSELAAWASRALLGDTNALHAACVITRHVRLLANHPERYRAHYQGALVRELALLGRTLFICACPTTSDELLTEARDLVDLASSLNRDEREALELAANALADELWAAERGVTVNLGLAEHMGPGARRYGPQRLPDSRWKTA
jgi:hypothetical protein